MIFVEHINKVGTINLIQQATIEPKKLLAQRIEILYLEHTTPNFLPANFGALMLIECDSLFLTYIKRAKVSGTPPWTPLGNGG